ncbi:MAG: hypothetical protein JW759_08960 [Candidatus Coatesbacteria bacterium]|nr:hypothetical protein [Candidatus Coatesbacteria bacterium]
MNPISAATGAGGALVRSVLGWLRNRQEAKDKGLPKPDFRWDRVIESMITGALAGLADPEPLSAALVGYFGSDAVGKGLRLTPARRILPKAGK